MRLHKLSSLEIMKLTYQCDIIIVDRHFFILGWFLSKLFQKKLCLRLLGLSTRLSSTRLFSKKNFIRVLTRISAVDLVISTLDASATQHDIKFIRSHKLLHRMNGIQSNKEETQNKKQKSMFFFVGRDSPEKGLRKALQIFSAIEVSSKRFDVFGPTQVPKMYQHLIDEGSLYLHGFCDRNLIKRRTLDHSIMISCNKLGALGNAELEALAAGKYIIYGGPKKFLSYLPQHLLIRYGRNYSEILHKMNSDVSELLNISDFHSVHQKDCDEIVSLLSNEH